MGGYIMYLSWFKYDELLDMSDAFSYCELK